MHAWPLRAMADWCTSIFPPNYLLVLYTVEFNTCTDYFDFGMCVLAWVKKVRQKSTQYCSLSRSVSMCMLLVTYAWEMVGEQWRS